MGQSADRTVLTTGCGLSFQHRRACFFLVPLVLCSSSSFQQKEQPLNQNSSLTNYHKSGFPVFCSFFGFVFLARWRSLEAPTVSQLYCLQFLLVAVCISDERCSLCSRPVRASLWPWGEGLGFPEGQKGRPSRSCPASGCHTVKVGG